MTWKLTPEEHEHLEKIVFELQTSALPVRVHAARLLLLTKLYRAVRDLDRLPPRVRDLLARIPRTSDKLAWDLLSAEEKRQADLYALEQELKK